MYVDSHAHIESEDFDGDRTAMIQRAVDAGVEIIVARIVPYVERVLRNGEG